MKIDYEGILKKAPFAYSYNKILLDGNGNPIDYKLLNVNHTFEKYTGFKEKDIINKTIRKIIPETVHDPFCFIKEYGEIAVNGGEREIEGFSPFFNKWFKINICSEKRLYFSLLFYDITDYIKTNNELKNSKDYLKNLLSNNPMIIYSNTIRDGKAKTTHISGNLIEALGLEANYFINKPEKWAEHLHPDDTNIIQKAIRQLNERGSFHLEYRFKDAHGKYHWIRDHAKVVDKTENHQVIIGSWFDITEIKKTEQQLKIFKEAIDNSTDAIGISTPEGKHYYQNKAFDKLFGDIGEKPIENIYTIREIGEEVFRTIMSGHKWLGETKMHSKDNKIIYVSLKAYPIKDEKGIIRALAGVHTDITELKKAEISIIEQNQKIDAILKTIPDIMFVMNTKGVFVDYYCSDPSKLTIPPDKVVGSNIRDILPEEEAERHLALYKKCVFEKTLQNIEFSFPFYDTVKYFEARLAPLNQDKVLSIIRDITEKKTAEEEREKLLNQLSHSQKMESIGQLAGGMAHDFNNMLTAILGNADLALIKCEKNENNKEEIQEIIKASGHSSDMIQQLLAFARKQLIDPVIIDLNKAVDNMINMLKRLIGENIQLIWNPTVDSAVIKMDTSQLSQLLTNLCVNARDAIEDTGKITISTDNAFLSKKDIENRPISKPGSYIILKIIDDGHGIDDEILPKIFDPFFTSKEIGQGTGLGLSTVYGIVKQNNGFIDIESKPGKGTSFSIFLPEYITKPSKKTETESQKPDMEGTETILLVEDQKEILDITAKMLKLKGYNILSASTPSEAIRLAKERKENIDLLITDIIMPEMNGRQLSEHLLAIFPRLRCLYISGYSADALFDNYIKGKDINFLQKPFSIKDLLTIVRNILEHD